MPDYRTSGMSADQSTYTRRAVAFIAAVAVVGLVSTLVSRALPDDTVTTYMHTDLVAGGITDGATVVLNGSEIGHVQSVTSGEGSSHRITLVFDENKLDRPELLTTTMEVAYAPKNLFGIGAVVLQTRPGGTRLRDGNDFYPETPTDSTLTTLLRNLSDLNTQAFNPYMSDVLKWASQATMGLLPIFGVVGQIAESIADTQRVSTRETLPQFAELVGDLDASVGRMLPAFRNLFDWPAPRIPGYVEHEERAFKYLNSNVVDAVGDLLGNEEIGRLMPAVPTVVEILERVRSSFPDARANGMQIAALLNRIRAAMPSGPDGPVLNVDVVLRSVPGVAAALGAPGGTP